MVVYSFEESERSMIERCENINISALAMIKQSKLSIVEVEALRFTPDEFVKLVRQEVEKNGTTSVMIDSIDGYKRSLGGENLVENLYALSKYLRNMGIVVHLTNKVESITGEFRATEVGISFMADTILFLRYVEMGSELRKAVGVLKKRTSDFQKTLREIEITRYGIKVGKPMKGMRGILRAIPGSVELSREGS